jgi:hypothetical protein
MATSNSFASYPQKQRWSTLMLAKTESRCIPHPMFLNVVKWEKIVQKSPHISTNEAETADLPSWPSSMSSIWPRGTFWCKWYQVDSFLFKFEFCIVDGDTRLKSTTENRSHLQKQMVAVLPRVRGYPYRHSSQHLWTGTVAIGLHVDCITQKHFRSKAAKLHFTDSQLSFTLHTTYYFTLNRSDRSFSLKYLLWATVLYL